MSCRITLLLITIFSSILIGCSDETAELIITLPEPEPPGKNINDLGTWSSVTPMPTSRKEISNTTIEHDGKIYVFGGIGRGGIISNSLEIYDIKRDEWSIGEKMPIKVWRSSIAEFNDKLYLFGGFESIDQFPYAPSNRVFEYDPNNNKWSEKSPMPTKRGSALALYYNSKIHVIGGANTRTLNTQEIYDPISDTWRLGTPMNTARSGLTGVVYKGNVYVIGGYSRTPHGAESINIEIELYNEFADQWKSGPDLPVERKGIAATLLNDKIYVFGGTVGANVSLTLELDPKTREWRELAEMPSPVSFMGVGSFKNSIYVFGGSPLTVNQEESFNSNRKFTPPE